MNGIPFTQYHLPNGRRTQEKLEVSNPSIAYIARCIIKSGGKFESEILTTGHVSMTVAFPDADGEMLDIAIMLCANEYGFIQTAFAMLVSKAAVTLGSRLKKVPYPEFCRHPDKCNGKSSCQAEFVCND